MTALHKHQILREDSGHKGVISHMNESMHAFLPGLWIHLAIVDRIPPDPLAKTAPDGCE